MSSLEIEKGIIYEEICDWIDGTGGDIQREGVARNFFEGDF